VELQRVAHCEPVFREVRELPFGEKERVRRADPKFIGELSCRVEQGVRHRRALSLARVEVYE
jgi:hypothetical protein